MYSKHTNAIYYEKGRQKIGSENQQKTSIHEVRVINTACEIKTNKQIRPMVSFKTRQNKGHCMCETSS